MTIGNFSNAEIEEWVDEGRPFSNALEVFYYYILLIGDSVQFFHAEVEMQ